MRPRSFVIIGLVGVAALAGCASGGAGASPTAPPAPSAAEDAASDAPTPPAPMPTADAGAQQRADAWLAAVELPPGAERVAGAPPSATALSGSYQGWWCDGMGLATGYWTIADMGVIETANWLMRHPTADLIVPVAIPYPEDDGVDAASVGNVPSMESLEGIAFTVARAEQGVAVRAEIGAIGESTVCETPAPGESFGGPGQG